jgi:hypothetical protein
MEILRVVISNSVSSPKHSGILASPTRCGTPNILGVPTGLGYLTWNRDLGSMSLGCSLVETTFLRTSRGVFTDALLTTLKNGIDELTFAKLFDFRMPLYLPGGWVRLKFSTSKTQLIFTPSGKAQQCEGDHLEWYIFQWKMPLTN